MNEWRVIVGDVREKLADLPDASVQCCVTSPPYWGLRDYGMDGQIGAEPTHHLYISAVASLFSENYIWRVLRDDGTIWLNLGDCYAAGGRGGGGKFMKMRGGDDAQGAWTHWKNKKGWRAAPDGLKPKDLVGLPWLIAFALQARGWYLRSDIIWSKPNPMPESVTDRPTKAHEYIFLLSKSRSYYYDADAIRQPFAASTKQRGHGRRHAGFNDRWDNMPKDEQQMTGSNARSVWSIATQPYPEAHFATFPEALPEKCIKAGTKPGDVVLDPFCGSGTTGKVAVQLARNFIGIELNPAYAELARRRIEGVSGLFAREVPA